MAQAQVPSLYQQRHLKVYGYPKTFLGVSLKKLLTLTFWISSHNERGGLGGCVGNGNHGSDHISIKEPSPTMNLIPFTIKFLPCKIDFHAYDDFFFIYCYFQNVPIWKISCSDNPRHKTCWVLHDFPNSFYLIKLD